MKRQRLRLRFVTFSTVFLLLVLLAVCGQQETSTSFSGLPAPFEAAILAGHWEEVEAAASAWMQPPSFRREMSILRGYAAIARGNSTVAMGHFFRARSGGRSRQNTGWGEALAVRYPRQAVAHLLAGDALARKGNWHGGLARLDTALELDPQLAVARLARGVLRMLTGERSAALDDLNALVTSESVGAEALVMRALVWLDAGQLDHALADLQQAIERAPEHAVAYNARGILHAQRGEWEAAAHNFATAFRILPELEEARRNWQLVQLARDRGAVISGQGSMGSMTIVVADSSKMHDMTASTSAMVQARTGQNPVIVTSLHDATAKAGTQHVILQMPARGLDMVAGERVLSTLNTIGASATGTKAPVNVVTHGFEGADRTTLGITRHLQTVSSGSRAHLSSLQIVDPSELSGPVGKTPLGRTDLGALAQRSGRIDAQGVPVAVYTVEGKVGTQHIGNVQAFRNTSGLDVYATPSKVGLETTLNVPLGVGIGLSNATDQASSRTNLQPRDWFIARNGTQQHVTGTVSDLGKRYIGINQQRPPETSALPSSSRGGIWLGPVHLVRGTGGRIAFESGTTQEGGLALVYTLFDGKELPRQASGPGG